MLYFTCLFIVLVTVTFNVQCARYKRYAGGHESQPNAWPWMCLLISGPEDWQVCGCSVVSNEWLLTAAHCVRDELGDPLKYHAILGDHKRYSNEGNEVKRSLSRVLRYDKYESTNHSFDIALLKMDEPIDFKEHPNIKPVCLDLKGADYEGKHCVGTGWGRIGKYGRMPDGLRELDMKPFDQKKCAEIHHDYYQHEDSKEEVTENQFCMVSSVNKNEKRYSSGSVCPGDSGGPLQCFINEKWIQIGVAWSATTYTTYPSVFNHVCKYADWIKNVTGITDETYC